MSTVQQITHIRKPNPQSPHEAIQAYGYPDGYGGVKVVERESFIAWLKRNSITAYVSSPGGTVLCDIRNNGHVNYLQTRANWLWTDNLLSLPPC